MANEKHLAILKQDSMAWNQWRAENHPVLPDFSEADLRATNLIGANLSGANLTMANLSLANLTGANLTRANLRRATIFGTNLCGTDLSAADWTETICSYGIFDDVDLSQVKGLEAVEHRGPSTIGIYTIYRSGGNIPEPFLRGAGIPDNFIAYMKSLIGQAFKFYSCFICHSSKDEEFAKHLYADLQNEGIRCWYAPVDVRIGAPYLLEIDEGIRLHDKLLLILSENSVKSKKVEHEVLSAYAKEHSGTSSVLFPIRLDDAVMNTNVTWAATIRDTRHIADFTQWKNHGNYRKAFDRLLRDLKGKQ
jgi:uncharacterized protein YjbI with pentapeptide repeats